MFIIIVDVDGLVLKHQALSIHDTYQASAINKGYSSCEYHLDDEVTLAKEELHIHLRIKENNIYYHNHDALITDAVLILLDAEAAMCIW